MTRRISLTAAYLLVFMVLLEIWPALAESARREVFTNDIVEVCGALVAIPLLLGALLGTLRRSDKFLDYLPFAVAPLAGFMIRVNLLDAPFTWVNIPLWSVASCSSIVGVWLQSRLLFGIRSRGNLAPPHS